MRVLIACEFSGVVRRAFRAEGHDAWSCDLIPAEDGSLHHFQADAISVICAEKAFDLVIAHPPCTYLCNSGVRWLYNKDGTHNEERWALMRQAAAFFLQFFDVYEGAVVVENPIMHKHAFAIIGNRAPRQIIQPWQFGHGETKATVLWKRDVPDLKPTNIVEGRTARVHLASPGPERWKERSRTMDGIAKAMAAQWGLTFHP